MTLVCHSRRRSALIVYAQPRPQRERSPDERRGAREHDQDAVPEVEVILVLAQEGDGQTSQHAEQSDPERSRTQPVD